MLTTIKGDITQYANDNLWYITQYANDYQR